MTVSKTVPEIMGNETSADNATVISTTTMSPEEQAKADEMFKLQQKISQEILNSNLKENEMNELQVRAHKNFSNIPHSNAIKSTRLNHLEIHFLPH